MPRAPRIEYAGAIYHVMNRGNHLDPIFRDQADRVLFLKTLSDTCEASGWVVHSFVLMRNHYHLLIETVRATLVVGMQYLDSTYTRRFNVRHKTFGHLFQGRYKALVVDGDSTGYFITVSDYIHMNPVRSGIISEVGLLLKDPWSSAGWLAGSRKGCPSWLKWQRVYGELSLTNWRSRSRREFREYLARRMMEARKEMGNRYVPMWEPIRNGWCLGSEEFVERLKGKLEELSKKPREPDSWAGPAVEEMELDRAVRLMLEGAAALGCVNPSRVRGHDRVLLARWVRSRCRVRIPCWRSNWDSRRATG